MVWCDAARAVLIGSVPAAQAAGVLTLAQLYVVASLSSGVTVFFSIAWQSYLPIVLEHDQLMEGNGKLGTSMSAAQVAGPGLGAVLVGWRAAWPRGRWPAGSGRSGSAGCR